MPVARGTDSKGAYYKWGAGGKKYHYTTKNAASRNRAKNEALKQGRAVQASKRRRAPTGGRAWITRPGKLGGPGYLARPAAERHRLLDSCVTRYGYRSCLGSLMVLNRNREIKALHGPKIDGDKRYLEKKYGAKTTGGAATLSSAARARKKVQNRARVGQVASYRRAAPRGAK